MHTLKDNALSRHNQAERSTEIENNDVDTRTKNKGHQNLPTQHVSESQHLDLTSSHTSPGQSLTTATVPRQSNAVRHVNHRLHRCANRNLHSSKLFRRSAPTYTPYHMMVESRPLNRLLRLIRAPLRLQRRYHADPLIKYAAFVVYIHMPIAIYAAASSLNYRGLPTHHTI
jgi:hypothetical protein